eukprot:CAMPEP_0115363884 /NCGR_PEP_ID=MMETSP0270-20121206/103471_1 /TAXON_ID=71861 /ORGANISM="Scrippsiella trochoidea, Strain CCMP3099" /LENGTH=240 /DNA_ID=CAMNT_0002786541 /DNA_START=62 /DNA_END=781 /DNA_ORIENTATION=-
MGVRAIGFSSRCVVGGGNGRSYVSAAKELLLNLAVAFIVDVDVNSAPHEVRILSEEKSIALLAIFVAAVLPLCLSDTMGGNAWISKLCVFCMFSAAAFFVGRCIIVLAQGCSPPIQCGEKPAAFAGSPFDVLEFTATLAFSFSMVFALFPVLKDRINEGGGLQCAVAVLRRSVRCSVLLCSFLYVVIGAAGAITFGFLGLSMGAYVMPCVLFLRLDGASQGIGSRMQSLVRLRTFVVLFF